MSSKVIFIPSDIKELSSFEFVPILWVGKVFWLLDMFLGIVWRYNNTSPSIPPRSWCGWRCRSSSPLFHCAGTWTEHHCTKSFWGVSLFSFIARGFHLSWHFTNFYQSWHGSYICWDGLKLSFWCVFKSDVVRQWIKGLLLCVHCWSCFQSLTHLKVLYIILIAG